MPSLNSLLSFGESETHSSSSFDMEGMCPSLSFKQVYRIMGFAICLITGIVFSILGTAVLFLSIVAFGVLYSLGNVMSLSSTLFLMGPMRQCKAMFDPTRLFATIIVIASIAATLFCAFYLSGKGALQLGLVILCLIIQFLALIWYALSYIPFARTAVINCCRGLAR